MIQSSYTADTMEMEMYKGHRDLRMMEVVKNHVTFMCNDG